MVIPAVIEPPVRNAPGAPPGRGRPHAAHRKPVRTFRVVGVFVIVLGALSGIYLGVGGGKLPLGQALLIFDAAPEVEPAADPALAQAAELAREKAASAAADAAAKAKQASDLAKREAEEASRSQTRTTYPVPTSCKEFTGNRALGCAVLLDFKFGLDQMPCLDKLWTKESHWRVNAENQSSGAYGIPQALPGTKMAEVAADWKTNPVTQIKWGLGYIQRRYGTPCNAWAHSQETGWY